MSIKSRQCILLLMILVLVLSSIDIKRLEYIAMLDTKAMRVKNAEQRMRLYDKELIKYFRVSNDGVFFFDRVLCKVPDHFLVEMRKNNDWLWGRLRIIDDENMPPRNILITSRALKQEEHDRLLLKYVNRFMRGRVRIAFYHRLMKRSMRIKNLELLSQTYILHADLESTEESLKRSLFILQIAEIVGNLHGLKI